MSLILKRALHWAGSALALLGIAFVALRLHDYGAELDFSRFDTARWLVVVGLALLYGIANLMLALAWWNLLEQFGASVSRRWAIKTYGISQLARYVPGNIFHLAGRQAMGMAAGLPARALAKSTLWELGLIAVAGVLFGFLAAPLVWLELPVFVSVGAFGAMSAGVVIALRRQLSPSVGAALIWQIIFLALSGVVFIGILALVAPAAVTFSAFSALCGAYVIAWLAGLITPGAPAGVGVRELVLLFLLKGVVTEADLLLAVVLGRLVTVGGDFLFFAAASASKGKEVIVMKTRDLGGNLLGWVLALLAALVVFTINFSVKGPMIQPDEGSYLANAAAIAGFSNDLASSYSAGYSLLLVPAFWFADTPEGVWAGVKAINAGLFFVLVVCLWFVAKVLSPDSSQVRRAGAVFLVALYPMWVVLAGYSFAQIAFVPVFLITFIAFSRAIEGGWITWFLLGLTAGFLYWIHPTAVAVLFALAISSGFVAVRRRAFAEYAILMATIAVMLVAYKYGFTPWLHENMTISGEPPHLHYPSVSKMLSPLGTLQGFAKVAVRFSGHVFYLILGTVGLIGVGLYEISSSALNLRNEKGKEKSLSFEAIAAFIWLSILGTLVLSVLLFASTPGAQRLDHWIYGRYVEGVIAPVLLAGALRSSYRAALWTIPVMLGCAVLFWAGLEGYSHTAPFNVSAFWQEFRLREEGVWAWAVSGIALISLVGLVPRRIAMFLIATVFAYSDYLQIDYHNRAAKGASSRWELALAVRKDFPVGTCVGFDHSGINSYVRHTFWFDFGFVLFDYGLQRMSFDKWIATCDGPFFSYAKDLDERNSGIYPAAVSPQGGPTLWVKGLPPVSELYPINVTDHSVSLLRALGTGWHDLEGSYVWSGKEAQVKLPMPSKCQPGRCRVKIHFSAFGASTKRPVDVFIRGNNGNTVSVDPIRIMTSLPQEVVVPLNSGKSTQLITIQIPAAISPKELQGSADLRVLGIALHRIELIETRSR